MFQDQLATLTQQLLSTARAQTQRQEHQLQTHVADSERDLDSLHANEVQKLEAQRQQELRIVQDRVQHLDERVAVWQQLAQAAEHDRDQLRIELDDVKSKARLKILELKEKVAQLKPLADRSLDAESVAKAGVERREAADKRIAQAQAQLTSMEDQMDVAKEVWGDVTQCVRVFDIAQCCVADEGGPSRDCPAARRERPIAATRARVCYFGSNGYSQTG
jgi:DNA repair exonuclease SbcCD ATPase subunit